MFEAVAPRNLCEIWVSGLVVNKKPGPFLTFRVANQRIEGLYVLGKACLKGGVKKCMTN
jgi:hypothetical protein